MELKEVKAKIGSVKNISDITRAMETFSALKMKKSQKRFLESKPFSEEMARMLKSLRGAMKDGQSRFMEQKKVRDILFCPVASDRGFCGAFNMNVLKFSDKALSALKKEGAVEVLPIGKKAIEHYKKTESIKRSFSGVGDYWEFAETKDIADFLIEAFYKNQYQKVYMAYMHFHSSFVQKPTLVQLFPLQPETVEVFLKGKEGILGETDYLLEPSSKVILDEVIPVFVEYLIYEFILSANTSEHSARMMAMRNASDNAKELLGELRLKYNKARQAQITSEVCEISSTKEAME